MSNWMQTVMFQTAHSLPEVRSFVQAAIGQTAHALPETSSWVQTVMGQTAHSTADGRDSDHEDAEPHGPSPRSFPDHPDHLLYESVRVLYEAVQGERGELGYAQGASITGSRRPPSPRSSATVGPESPSPPRPSKTESSAPEQPEIEPPSDPPHPSSYWQTVLGGRTAPQPTKRGRPPPEQEDDDDGPEPAPKRPCV